MKEEKLQPISQKYKRLWDYYEQLYVNKLDNPEEMNKFLETQSPQKLNQEEIDNLNSPITTSEI